MRVLVTGVSGNVGRRLLERLDADPAVGTVVGLDVTEFSHPSKKFRYHRMDMRDPGVAGIFKQHRIDALVHLAFVLIPMHDRRKQWDINVHGSKNVLRAAVESGVRKIAYASSGHVYGAWPDNPVPLTEERVPRPNPKVQYQVEKLELEKELAALQRSHPDLVWTALRPATIVGPDVRNPLVNNFRKMVRKKRFFGLRGGAPMQFVHQDDVAEAFYQAVIGDHPGVFNLAPDGLVDTAFLRQRGYRVFLFLPGAARLFAALAWHLRLLASEPATVDLIHHPWVVSNEKIKREWGFRFKFSSIEALESTAELKKP